MQSPLQQLPRVLAQCIQAKVSLERLDKFFAAANIDPCTTLKNKESSVLSVRGGNFHWDCGRSEPGYHLRNIDFDINCGKLVIVVGAVGAGKSSLISALLRDMVRTSGRVVINVSKAVNEMCLHTIDILSGSKWSLYLSS
ncbi:hypothetical protein SK128_008044 [Halocaridina rubra]|uniref:ABC transporter domain-containing protein n=1 Tax=Halocaridina rubra TaxID=373956 RepID=A0AAN8WC44_HALRR